MLRRASTLTLPICVATFAAPALLNAQQAPADRASKPAPTSQSVSPTATTKPLNVVVTIPPLKGLVEPLLPKGSTLTTLVRPGRSEHGYEFTADEIAKLAKADIVVLVGLGLEPRVEQSLERSKNKDQMVLNWGELEKLSQPKGSSNAPHDDHGDHDGHDHDDHSDHAHDDHDHDPSWIDQHLWLDPAIVERFVTKVSDAIRHARPNWPEAALKEIEAGRENTLVKVRAIDSEYRSTLAPFNGSPIICHHDAYSRLASRYDLKVVAAIKSTSGREPTAKDIAGVVKAIQESNAKAIFIEPQFDPTLAHRIAKLANVNIAQLDPLGDGDWSAMMRKNLKSLKENLGTKQ